MSNGKEKPMMNFVAAAVLVTAACVLRAASKPPKGGRHA
jgi:hypothetical protein